MIVAGKNHLASWYQNSGFSPHRVIAVIENDWTTNKKGMYWIRYFEKLTKHRTICGFRLLILDVQESYHSDEFEEYLKGHKILLFVCLLIPLIYPRKLMFRFSTLQGRSLPALYAAFNIAVTDNNI